LNSFFLKKNNKIGLSIPIEGAIEWPNCFYLGGEKNSQGAQRSQNNLNYLKIEKVQPLFNFYFF